MNYLRCAKWDSQVDEATYPAIPLAVLQTIETPQKKIGRANSKNVLRFADYGGALPHQCMTESLNSHPKDD